MTIHDFEFFTKMLILTLILVFVFFTMRDAFVSKRQTWHEWFAWYPVMIDDEKVWLKSVYRRGTYVVDEWDQEVKVWEWEYIL